MNKIGKLAAIAAYSLVCFFSIKATHNVASAYVDKCNAYRDALRVYFDRGGKHNAGKDYNGGNSKLEPNEMRDLFNLVRRKYDINEITCLSARNEFPAAYPWNLERAVKSLHDLNSKKDVKEIANYLPYESNKF